MTEAILTVPDISCGHCAQTVTSALTPAEGVEQVTVDIPSKTVKVVYDGERVGVDKLSAILADADYPVANVSQ
jgi:copper chaperone